MTTHFLTCNYIRQDDTSNLFSLTFYKIYESLIKNDVNDERTNKLENLS